MEKILSKNKIIGVLGGMGPQATVEFYKLLIDKSISIYGAVKNDDFPEIVIDSLPVPDFIGNTVNLQTAKKMILDRVRRLNDYPVDCICIACNTAHILIKSMREASKVPIVSVVEEIKKVTRVKGFRRIGLLATPTTYKMGIYGSVNIGLVKLYKPDITVQYEIESLTKGVISGGDRALLRRKFVDIISLFVKEKKLDALILGCTELPLIFPDNFPIQAINSLSVLADSVLRLYFS